MSKSKQWTVKTECTASKFDTQDEAESFARELIEGEDACANVEIIAPK